MKEKNTSLDDLQTALGMELTAVHQYMLHAHVIEDWGLDRLAAKMQSVMHEELRHARQITRRIMFLKGDPHLQPTGIPRHSKTLDDMFRSDLAGEEEARFFYSQAVQTAAKVNDVGTRLLFERTLVDKEVHQAWLELQLELLERLGEPRYLATHLTNHSSSALTPVERHDLNS